MRKTRSGFTVVELLIVVVVITILAAITIVVYNGIQDRARASVLTSALADISKKARIYHVDHDAYPAALTDIGITDTSSIHYTYQKYPNDSDFCATASTGSTTYQVRNGVTATPGVCNALTAAFYSGTSLSGTPLLQRQDTTINYSWGGGSPGSGVPNDNFSVRWNGYLTAPTTGVYTFYVSSDDGQRLYINGSLVVDDWVAHGTTTRNTTVSLTAGDPVSFTYEMFENGGGAVARAEWSGPSVSRSVIPADAFLAG